MGKWFILSIEEGKAKHFVNFFCKITIFLLEFWSELKLSIHVLRANEKLRSILLEVFLYFIGCKCGSTSKITFFILFFVELIHLLEVLVQGRIFKLLPYLLNLIRRYKIDFNLDKLDWDHSFSMYANFSKKLTFLTT